MNGIKMSECRFYVNEDERVIVCVIPDTCDLVIDFINDNFNFSDIGFGTYMMDRRLVKDLTMPNSFTGKAVCAPEDEWDEETGKLIAFARAKDKCYKSFFKRATRFVQTIDRRLGDCMTQFNDFGTKLEHKRVALEDMINERTKVK